jgi:hypothetical protein
MKNIILLIALVLNLCCAAFAADIYHPVSHWKLDETSGTIAYDSAGANNGTVTGATWTTGKIDGALNFNSNGNMVRILDSASLDPSNAFTVTAWVNATELSGNGSNNGNPIIVKWGSNSIGQ